MDLDLIERLMRLLENSSVDELELTENGTRIRLSKMGAPQSSAASAASSSKATRANATASASATGSKEHVIVAGLPGTFYRSPSPESGPFVNVGDRTTKGKVLCIIEAMKLMNEIESDVDGVIAKIYPSNGQPVEYGEKLFAVKAQS